ALCDLELSVGDRLEAFVQERCPPRGPCPHRDLLLHVLRRYGGDWRCQVSAGRWPYGGATHWTASLAVGSRGHFRGRFGIHQRIATATPEDNPCAVNLVVYSSIDFAGVPDLLDDPRAVHGLVQRLDAELKRALPAIRKHPGTACKEHRFA